MLVIAALSELVDPAERLPQFVYHVSWVKLLERVALDHGRPEGAIEHPLGAWVEEHHGRVKDGRTRFHRDPWLALMQRRNKA